MIIGSAERFDVRVTLPSDKYKVGDTLWIRAETLENRAQVCVLLQAGDFCIAG